MGIISEPKTMTLEDVMFEDSQVCTLNIPMHLWADVAFACLNLYFNVVVCFCSCHLSTFSESFLIFSAFSAVTNPRNMPEDQVCVEISFH
jgi:hypothetical protein